MSTLILASLASALLAGLLVYAWGISSRRESDRKQQESLLAQKEAQLRAEHLEEKLQQQKEGYEERLQELRLTQEKAREQFQALANEQLIQKSENLQQQNKEQLGSLLSPLADQLGKLNKSVQDARVQDAESKTQLNSHLRQLMERTEQIGSDAVELAQALKGNNKVQGDWGEMVLESLLTHSGLRKGIEYDTQVSIDVGGGKQLRPDLIVKFPQGQKLIIDAKVSLTAYSRLVQATDEQSRLQEAKSHSLSLRQHIKEIAQKDYIELGDFPYVLLFIPNEAAYIAAITQSPELLEEAQQSRILLISPANLLMAIKLCYSLWQQHRQVDNIQHIVDDCGKIYDKFVTFLAKMDQVESSLEKAHAHYEEAHKYLCTGRGNIIARFEKIKGLGVTPNKSIPEKHLSQTETLIEEETQT